jgi:hypothetical protein
MILRWDAVCGYPISSDVLYIAHLLVEMSDIFARIGICKSHNWKADNDVFLLAYRVHYFSFVVLHLAVDYFLTSSCALHMYSGSILISNPNP